VNDQSPRQTVIDHIEDVRARWRRLVADVGPDRLEEPGAMGDWTFKDVAAHVTAWRRRTVKRVEALVRGEPEPAPPWPAALGEDEDDPINAWIHDQTKDRPADQLLREADAVYDELIDGVRKLPDDVISEPGRIPWLGGGTLTDTDFGGHLDSHEPDVRRWLEAGRAEGR
jgi:Mycothiol maleylpyruvate isomerase N-terminal domain